MDLYNRWFMRATGEKRYQAANKVEKATFVTFDILKEKGILKSLTEPELIDLINDIHSRMQSSIYDL